MKKTTTLGVVVTLSAALLVAACGDESTTEVTETTGAISYDDMDKLPKCTNDNQGSIALVKKDGNVYVCSDASWKTLGASSNADANFSCSMKPLSDSTGYKVICGGDSLGVILNGLPGKQGAKGEQGEKGETGAQGKEGDSGSRGQQGTGCTLAEGDSGKVTVTCGELSTTLFKAMCDGKPFDPVFNKCNNDGSLTPLCDGEVLTSDYFCFENTKYEKCNYMEYNPNEMYCTASNMLYGACKPNITSDDVADFINNNAYEASLDNEGKGHACDDATCQTVIDSIYLYDADVFFCHGSTLYELCGMSSEPYNPITQYCDYNDHVEPKLSCGDDGYYNPNIHYCGEGGTILTLLTCGSEKYNPEIAYCENDVVVNFPTCGTESTPYNPEVFYCNSGVVTDLSSCGTNKFNPQESYCDNNTVYTKPDCGSSNYNPKTHYCYEENTVKPLEICGNRISGERYNPQEFYCLMQEGSTRTFLLGSCNETIKGPYIETFIESSNNKERAVQDLFQNGYGRFLVTQKSLTIAADIYQPSKAYCDGEEAKPLELKVH